MAIEVFTVHPAATSFKQDYFSALDDSLNAHYRNHNNAVAELERSLIRERVVMGLDRAKKQGKQLGRPRVTADAVRIASLRVQGHSWSEISAKTGVSKGTAQRAILGLPRNPAETAAVNA